MAARIVDHHRPLGGARGADLGIAGQLDALAGSGGIVAGGVDRARLAAVDEHQRDALHRQPAGDALDDVGEQPLRLAPCSQRGRHLDERGQIVGLAQQLLAVLRGARERAQERRQVLGRAHHRVDAGVGGRRIGGEKADDQRMALSRLGNQAAPGEIDHRRAALAQLESLRGQRGGKSLRGRSEERDVDGPGQRRFSGNPRIPAPR